MESLTPSEEEERDNVGQEQNETVDNQPTYHNSHHHHTHHHQRSGLGLKQQHLSLADASMAGNGSSTLSASGLGKHQTYAGLLSRRTPLSASVKSAFSSYVRRGEPDGRTAASGESRGRESDAAFTPSPVDPVHRSNLLAHQGRSAHGASGSIAGLLAGMTSSAGSDRGVPVPSLRMSLTLAHQSKIRSMYCSRQSLTSQENGSSPASEVGAPSSGSDMMMMNTPSALMMQMGASSNKMHSRPDSSSSANSSVADWESGLSTVRRQPPPPPPPTASGSKVEDISAFGDSRLRVGTIAKAFEMHGVSGSTLANARSGRSRFKPPNSNSHFAAGLRKLALGHSAVAVEEANASNHSGSIASVSKANSRSGSLDTLDRLSVRSEVVKPPAVQQQQQQQQQQMTQQQLQKEHQRRRHRSVDRHLDTDTDSVGGVEVDSTTSSTTDALINERFSAAVFQHRTKPGVVGVKKLSLAKVAAPNHVTGNSNGHLMHPNGKPPIGGPMMNRPAPKMSLAGKQQQMQLHHPIEAIGCVSDHEMDPPSSAIYSLRSGDADMSSALGIGGSSTGAGGNGTGSRNNIQDHIIATQMNRLNREMPISDVYHERNMGLGLAPGLAELLVTSQQGGSSTASSIGGLMGGVGPVATSSSVASSEDVFSSFDQISLADTATELSDKADLAALKSVGYAKRPPPRPSKPSGGHHSSASSTSSWSANGTAGGYHHVGVVGSRQRMSVFSDSSDGGADLTSAAFRQSMLEMTRRDEADGRSMTDSNYSGYSPHRNLKLSTIMQQQQQHSNGNDMTVLGAGPAKGSNTIHAVAIIEADHSRANMINESTV